jgi:hypothetical protein
MNSTRSGRTGLDPVGRLRLPRRHTIVRAAAAAALLSLAAVVAWHGPDRPTPGGHSAPGGPVAPTPSPTVTAPSTVSAPAAPLVAPSGSRLPVPVGMIGVPVTLSTAAATALVHPGDRVDLLAVAGDGNAPPVPVAETCTVLGVDRPDGALLLALTPAQAEQVLTAPGSTRFAVIVRPPA